MICSVCHDEGAIMHGSPLFPTEQPSVHRQCVGQYNRNKIRETITRYIARRPRPSGRGGSASSRSDLRY